MSNKLKLNLAMLLSLLGFGLSQSYAGQKDISNIVESELNREFEVLSNLSPSVYYLAYRIDESTSWSLQGAFGDLVGDDKTTNRYLTTMVRVGDNSFDNTHVFKGDGAGLMFSASLIPYQDNADAIHQAMWKQTDKAYKQAKSDYLAKKNKIKFDETSGVGDFSKEDPVKYNSPVLSVTFSDKDMDAWRTIVRACSKVFLSDPDIKNGDVSFEYAVKRKYFISSEGSMIAQNLPYARVMISGLIKSEEGNEMPMYKSFYAESPDKLPSGKQMLAETVKLVAKLVEIKNADVAQPYSGPAILSPQSAGVFFHEIFGHRVEGHRLKDETDGQTFKTKLGEKVLPKFMSVTFDPRQEYLGDTYLIGHYKYDDQGVPAQKVDIVSNGVLENFLLSRIPIDGFEHSNGHGRASIGASAVARQSNMIISTDQPKSIDELRKKLVKECKKQKLEYGYYFKEVTGGFTQTGRHVPNAFNVIPTEVYKIFVDGRPDELVRGVDLIGTPLSMFSAISDAGDQTAVFTGFCGAESGWVPVSAASPAIFVRKIETQKKGQTYSKGTLLPAPSANDLMHN